MTPTVMMMTSLQIKSFRDFYNDIDEDCNPENDFDLDGDGVDIICLETVLIVTTQISIQQHGDVPSSALKDQRIRLATSEELSNGLYWIDSDDDGDTSNAEQALCDMDLDDGGWTLASRISVDGSSPDWFKNHQIFLTMLLVKMHLKFMWKAFGSSSFSTSNGDDPLGL